MKEMNTEQLIDYLKANFDPKSVPILVCEHEGVSIMEDIVSVSDNNGHPQLNGEAFIRHCRKVEKNEQRGN